MKTNTKKLEIPEEMIDERTEEYINDSSNEEMVNTGVPEFTEEQKEYARMNVRKQFNENFSKWAHIADENATDEDIEAAKKDYEAVIEETQKKTYTLATSEGDCANRTARLLFNWNKDMCNWKNGSWRGVIAFDKYITSKINALGNGTEKDLVVDYSTLCFLYTNMSEPCGIGIDDAFIMAELENFDIEKNEIKEDEYPVTYSGILEKVCTEVQKLSNIDKKLLILRERVNLAYAGLKMELKITELEEFIEFADAINTHTVSQEMTENK